MGELSNILTDQLTDMREQARTDKNYLLSDQIRNELDSRGSYAFDTPTGQVVYHVGKLNHRASLEAEIKKENRLNNVFDSWLYSIKSKRNG